jgi:hypothetical protein
MPLIGLYALVLAFAAQLVPRRAREAALVVALSVGVLHLLKAFELTVQRYWL